jgi:hypothetical protein
MSSTLPVEQKTMRDHTINAIFNSTQNYTPNNYTYPSDNITIADCISTDASMHIDGKLEVQGRNVLKELDEMRDALLLLKRDADMEAKYPKLKELKDAYEAQLEKYKIWEALK